MQCWALIAAGGQGARLSAAGFATPKQFIRHNGAPLYWLSAVTLARVARVHGLIFIFPHERLEQARQEIQTLCGQERLGVPWLCVPGGDTRQESVRSGLLALPPQCDTVLIHDAARPFASPALCNRVLDALDAGAPGAIPGIAVSDTIKEVDLGGQVRGTPPRQMLRAVQTPQGFQRDIVCTAHERAHTGTVSATDDAALLEHYGHQVRVVEGEAANRKITTPDDLELLARHAHRPPPVELRPCIGFGYDVHAYGGGRPFILGGVPIATDIGVKAHSDGDTLLHALIDALLGCIAGGDIGTLFPDTDPAFAGIPSGILLAETLRKTQEAGLCIHHVDCTIVAQTPRLAPHTKQIAHNIATLLRLTDQAVNVKATTEEKLGFTGQKQGIKAYAVVCGQMPVL